MCRHSGATLGVTDPRSSPWKNRQSRSSSQRVQNSCSLPEVSVPIPRYLHCDFRTSGHLLQVIKSQCLYTSVCIRLLVVLPSSQPLTCGRTTPTPPLSHHSVTISYDGSDKKENKSEWHKRVRRGKTAKRQVHSDPVCVFVSSKSEIQMTSEWAIRPKFVSRFFDRLFWLLLTPQVQALDRQQNNSSNVWTPADLAARNTRREKKRNTHTFMCMYTPEKFFKHKLRPNCEESFRISP